MAATSELLDRVELLASLDASARAQLAAEAEAVALGPGDALFEEGEDPTHFFVVADGELESTTGRGDQQVRWTRHQVGGVLGVMPLITGEAYVGCARAREPAVVWRWPAERLFGLLGAHPGLRPAVGKLLVGASRELEQALHRQQKLATLGTLQAGLAHELGNPASAARRAAAELERAARAEAEALAQMPGLGPLAALRAQVLAAEPVDDDDPVARSDREDALYDALEEAGVADAGELSTSLADAGLQAGVVLAATDAARESGVELVPALRWLAAGADAASLARTIGDAAGRMAALVDAIKGFYAGGKGEQDVDLVRGLVQTKLLLAHKLRDREVQVVKELEPDLPAVHAHGAELNQVWTNLIVNAIEALGEQGGGTLTLRARRAQGGVEVQVADDGPGIPDDVRERVFDPFFTTKDVGAGTGMGLDVVRRIVEERHGGRITVESSPGQGTTFSVWLPASGAVRPR